MVYSYNNYLSYYIIIWSNEPKQVTIDIKYMLVSKKKISFDMAITSIKLNKMTQMIYIGIWYILHTGLMPEQNVYKSTHFFLINSKTLDKVIMQDGTKSALYDATPPHLLGVFDCSNVN